MSEGACGPRPAAYGSVVIAVNTTAARVLSGGAWKAGGSEEQEVGERSHEDVVDEMVSVYRYLAQCLDEEQEA